MIKLSRMAGFLGAVFGTIVAGVLATGCATNDPPGQGTDSGFAPVAGLKATGEQVLPETTDEIHIGDSLVISFSDLAAPLMPIEQIVHQDGTITLLQNKTFVAAGKTRGELEQEIHNFYVPDYYKQMTVYIKPSDRWFFVDGEVKQPNRQIFLGAMTVRKAITAAGGFTDFAKKKKVKLIHPDGRSEVIDCRPKSSADRPVYPGDTVHVLRRFW